MYVNMFSRERCAHTLPQPCAEAVCKSSRLKPPPNKNLRRAVLCSFG